MARTTVPKSPNYSKTPSTILQAKQAVALARFAGAERDATEEYREAESLLANAENAWKAGRDEEVIDIGARRAISAAVKAESTAFVRKEAREKRNEKARADAETRQAEAQFTDAQNEIAELKRQLQDEIRQRELSERDVSTYSNQIKDLRAENGRLREDLGRMRVEADNAKARIDAIESERRAELEQRAKEQRIGSLEAGEPAFMQALRRFGRVSKNERGIILTLPETFWSAARASNFAPAADAKLSSLGEVLANNPDYKLVIESHTDDRGTGEELSALTEQRARLIAERLTGFGVADGRIEAKGMGATLPIAPNTTNANRSKNRRVNVILIPNI
jgi:outer membrane protein OmpA-like peptidoglycan-associated protein